MNNTSGISLVSLFAITLIIAQFSQPVLSQTPNEILAAELDEYIIEQMNIQNIPGLSACIVKEGQVVWKDAYGMANIELDIPVTLETEFTLASISKLFTATACAQLWENNLLDIDADINNYLPINVINPNFPETPITVRQLLQHKSSLHDYETDLQLWINIGDPIFDLETFCTNYFVDGGDFFNPSNFGNTAPGSSSYWYSNAGFTLLGYIVQEVSGIPFNEYCEENIFEPLEMNTAGWFYSDIDTTDVAMPYNGTWQPYGYYSVPEYPAAMLKSNVEELANFLIAYTQEGVFIGESLFSSDTFGALVPENMQNGFAWWGMDTWYGDQNGNYWSHGGFMNGVRTQLNYYPDDATGLIILTNGEGNYSPIQNTLEDYIPQFEVDTTNSISDILISDITIFPNPISHLNELNIEFRNTNSQTIQIEMYDTSGNLVIREETNEQQTSISMSKLAQGAYLLKVNYSGGEIIRRVVVE